MKRHAGLPAAVLAAVVGAWLGCGPAATDRPRPPRPIRPAPPLVTPEERPDVSPSREEDGERDAAASTAIAPRAAPTAPARRIDILPVTPPRRTVGVTLPASIRVGLVSDLEEVQISCCEADLVARVGGESFSAARGLVVRPAPEARDLAVFRLQVGALRDEGQADALARRLGASMGVASDVVFDAASGLHKVRVGAYSDRPAADRGKRRLAELGVPGAFTVHEDHGLAGAGLVIDAGGGARRVASRALDLETSEGVVRYGKSAYRGLLRVYLNERGRLNVINELSLEDYLRGVVPMELGPELYPELEALKAQAVAARSYTLRNLARFGGDGYDICATPRCQVYGGAGVEHPLSDRAIAETAGEVALYDGEAIDALYSSTCGGRTELVSWVFPEKDEPYLHSVPCVEGGEQRFGSGRIRTSPESWILEVTLGRIEGDDRARLEERIRRVAQLVAVPRPGDRLRSLERLEVRRFLASQLDLALDATLLSGSPDRADLVGRDRRLLSVLEGAAVATEPERAASRAADRMTPSEADALVVELLRYFGKVDVVEARFHDAGEGLEVATGGRVESPRLASSVGTWRFDGASHRAGALALAPGDPLDLYLVRDVVVAVVQHATAVGPGVAVRHDRQRWTMFRGRSAIERLVREQFPGFALADLVVLERGTSGRVARLELVGRDGRREVLAGLPIRWMLDVPDNWFDLTRTRSRSGEDGWLFQGRGWGHGVGMCQVGAFAMARRGHDYHDILEHYYRGVGIRRVDTASSPSSRGRRATVPQ